MDGERGLGGVGLLEVELVVVVLVVVSEVIYRLLMQGFPVDGFGRVLHVYYDIYGIPLSCFGILGF